MTRGLPVLIFVAAVLMSGCTGGSSVSVPSAPAGAGASAATVKGLLARPEGNGPFPAVVLLHTCGGMNPHVTADWPRYLTSIGYVVFSVDSFGARGLGPCPNRLWSRTDHYLELITADAYGALDHLSTLPFVDAGRVAVMGFSLGAIVINLDMIPRNLRSPGGRQFKAAISLYGVCATTMFPAKPLAAVQTPPFPLLLVIPERDERMARTCANVTQSWVEKQALPSAYHAFDQPQFSTVISDPFGNSMLYSRDATEQAHERAKAYLAGKLKS